MKQDHAIEFDDMQQQLGARRRRDADTDEEHESGDPVLYTPHFRAENPFHPRPTTVSLAPQVYPMYGDPTYDSLKRRGKDSESVLREHVTLTCARSRIFDIIHAMETDRVEFSSAIEQQCGGDKADSFGANVDTVKGVYDLLHNRHQLTALITSFEEQSGNLSPTDAGKIAYLEQLLYGASGPDAKGFTSNSKIAKGLKTFHTKHTYAVLNAGAKANATAPNTSKSSLTSV